MDDAGQRATCSAHRSGRMAAAIAAKLCLDKTELIARDNGVMLTDINLAAMSNLANVKPVLEHVV